MPKKIDEWEKRRVVFSVHFKCRNCSHEWAQPFRRGDQVCNDGTLRLWNKEYRHDEYDKTLCPNCGIQNCKVTARKVEEKLNDSKQD